MNYFALLPLLSAIVNVFLWTFVFAVHSRTNSKKVYLVFIALCASWGMSDFLAWSHHDAAVQYWILRISTFTWLSLTPMYLFFAYLLIQRPIDWIMRGIGIATVFFMVVGAATGWIVESVESRSWGVVIVPGKLYYPALFLCVLLPGILSMRFVGKRALGSSGLVRRQLVFFLSGISLTFGLVLLTNVVIVMWMRQIEFPSIGSSLVCIQAIVVFIASTRYRFLNVGVQEVAMDIFSKASDGVILLDYNGRIIEINSAAQKILGGTGSPLLTTHIEEFIPTPYQFGRDFENLEIVFTDDRRSEPQVGLLSQCDFYQGKIWAGKLITIRNITALKAAEAARQTQIDLQEKVRRNQEIKMLALGELAGEIVHNFNNLMSGIIGYNSLLQRRLKNNPEVTPLLEGIQRTVENAVRMGKDLLRFTHMDDSQNEEVDLHRAIHNSVNLANHSFGEKFQIEASLNAEHATVMGTSADIENMLLNLCINAKEAMPDGGSIFIATENRAVGPEDSPAIQSASELKLIHRLVRLTVEDTGPGVPPEIADRIFEPFFTTRKHKGGTGLGLSNTFGIVKKLGGTITVESQPGRGAIFVVTLPVYDLPVYESK